MVEKVGVQTSDGFSARDVRNGNQEILTEFLIEFRLAEWEQRLYSTAVCNLILFENPTITKFEPDFNFLV